jgi:hypothetical protein
MTMTLSVPLQAAISSSQRRPFVAVTATRTRAGLDLLRWERWFTASETDRPHAAVVTPDNGGSLIRARNNAGDIDVSRVNQPNSGSTFTSWTNLVHTIPAASCVALAARSGEIILLTTDAVGTALRIRTSSDDGVTWSSSTTLVTEASAIEHIALAFKPGGDCCAFYTLAATTTLKRLRRTSGVWAGSGTNWSRSGSVATLTGIAATHDGADFALLVTGTEVTTTHRRAWAVRMGDLGLPANAWSALNSVAEADALSTTSYASPTIALISSDVQGAYAQLEAGNVAFQRAFTTRPQAAGGAGSIWTEGAPHEATGAHGIAYAYDGYNQIFACRPGGVWLASIGASNSLTVRVLTAEYTIALDSAKCRVELEDRDRALDNLDDPNIALFPGCDLTIAPGYFTSANAGEFGVVQTFTIDRVTAVQSDGRRRLIIDGSAGWEQLDRWRAPQAWQTAAGVMTRSEIFARIAGRAGCVWALGTDPQPPSSDWTTYQPAFAIAAGESASSVLKRLLTVVPDFVRANGATLEVVSTSTSDIIAATYQLGAGADLDASAYVAVLADGNAPNWFRVQGPDRYAEAVDFDSVYTNGASPRLIRNLDATTDAKASAWASNALRRITVEQPFGQLTAPFHPGLQLLDRVVVGAGYAGHIVAVGMKYARVGKTARYDSVLTLGGD